MPTAERTTCIGTVALGPYQSGVAAVGGKDRTPHEHIMSSIIYIVCTTRAYRGLNVQLHTNTDSSEIRDTHAPSDSQPPRADSRVLALTQTS